MIEILKNMTIGSWLTAGVIILLRLIFRGGISPKAKYLLWLMLMVRLMVPVLPESDFGILDRPDTVLAVESSNYNMYVDQDDIVQTAPVESSESVIAFESAETETYSSDTVQTQQPKSSTVNPVVIWAVGVVLCLALYLIMNVKTALRLRKAVCVDDPEALRCYIRVRKLLGVKRELRFCYGAESLIGGLIKPVLLIPRELSGEKLEAALIHELMHYRSGDLWITALQRILCCFHWFNPVVWICFYWARQDCEKACDQRVMELNKVSPAVYAELLLQETMLKRRTQIGTTAFGSGNIKQRIRAIANYRRPAFYMTVLAVVVILFAAFFTLTARANGPWRWTKELTLSDITHVTITCADQQQTLGEEDTEKFLRTINALDKRDFEENKALTGTTPDTFIAITCGDSEYYINRVDGPYGQFEISYGGKQWWIQSEALNEKVSDILSGIFTEDLSPAMYPLSILLNVPEESIMNGLASITAEKSFDTVNRALDTLMGQYITDDFKSYFSGGTGIGDLWTGAMRYGYSSFCRELKVTVEESDQTNFQYEATLDITLQNDQIHTVPISGVVRCNQNYRVTSISIDNGALRELHAMLDETILYTEEIQFAPVEPELAETQEIYIPNTGWSCFIRFDDDIIQDDVIYTCDAPEILTAVDGRLLATGVGECNVELQYRGLVQKLHVTVFSESWNQDEQGNQQAERYLTEQMIMAHILSNYLDGLEFAPEDPIYFWKTMWYFVNCAYPEYAPDEAVATDETLRLPEWQIKIWAENLYILTGSIPDIPEITVDGRQIVRQMDDGSYEFIRKEAQSLAFSISQPEEYTPEEILVTPSGSYYVRQITVEQNGAVVASYSARTTGAADNIDQCVIEVLPMKDETTVSFKPNLQEIKETLYSDFHLGGDFYQAENCTLKEFLSAVPNADSLTLSTGDVIWRVPRDKCASAANEIGVGFEILTDNEAEYGYFYLTDDATLDDLAEQLGLLVQQEEGKVLTKLEAFGKYPDGTVWATVFFEKDDSGNEGLYLFELSDSDFSVLSMVKK